MAGFFDSISDFLLGILSGDPQAVRLRKQLKELGSLIAEFKPAVYNKSSETLLPGLAMGWYHLFTYLAPLSDLFGKTIAHSDRKIAEFHLASLIEAVLDGAIADRRVDLGYEALSARFAAAANGEQEAVAVGQEFQFLLADVKKQDSPKWQADFSTLFRWVALARTDFAPLFRHFGMVGLPAAGKAPQFRAAPADAALPDLIDLYFVLTQLDTGPGFEYLISLLLEKVSPSKAAENRQKMSKILQRARDLLVGVCSPGLTLNLIRLIKKDPDYVPEVLNIKDRYLANYASSLQDRFINDRERALREQNESGLEKDIKALFPDSELLPLTYYGLGTNQRLTEVGLPSLTWIKPLQILRSFAYAVLKTHYLDSVKLVVLNGFFQDKDWQAQLGADLAAAEQIAAVLERFDESLIEEGKATLVSLEKYLNGQVAASSTGRLLVEKINHNASVVLESQVRVLNSLSLRVADILSDYKSPQPQQVTNIKGLGGKDQRAMVESLITGYNKSAQALKILKKFVVLKGTAS